ncbi:MAG: hypothetical protein WC609_02815 [Candidatus Paceibacterota bacterium]|jgi:hypothetical protein
MKKNIVTKIALLALLIAPLSMALPAKAAPLPNWNAVGTYVWLAGGVYAHDMVITNQNPDGTFSGTGGYPSGGSPYTAAGQTPETITGQVTGDTVTFTTTYSGPLNPGYSVTATGTIAPDGTMSGTSPFEWHTTSGMAAPILALPGTLTAEDFGVVNYDTGLGILKGYTAGFGLTDATFAGATSVVVQLFNGSTLLQTNTAILPKFNTDITGTQFSSPFDVSGTFDYGTDGYWTNVKETQYGQSVPATKVVATVTLANGKVVTAENTNLTGDPTTIYPTVNDANVTTDAATGISTTDAMLNGTNGGSAATGHSFWVSLAPFVTTSPVIPSGVYSTPDFGAIAANTPFSASLSSITTTGIPSNLPAITPNTTYYFAAWSFVDGTWYPGEVLSFKTSETIGGGGGHDGNENEGIENENDDNGNESINEDESSETDEIDNHQESGDNENHNHSNNISPVNHSINGDNNPGQHHGKQKNSHGNDN